MKIAGVFILPLMLLVMTFASCAAENKRLPPDDDVSPLRQTPSLNDPEVKEKIRELDRIAARLRREREEGFAIIHGPIEFWDLKEELEQMGFMVIRKEEGGYVVIVPNANHPEVLRLLDRYNRMVGEDGCDDFWSKFIRREFEEGGFELVWENGRYALRMRKA